MRKRILKIVTEDVIISPSQLRAEMDTIHEALADKVIKSMVPVCTYLHATLPYISNACIWAGKIWVFFFFWGMFVCVCVCVYMCVCVCVCVCD